MEEVKEVLNKRNTETIAARIKDLDKRYYDMQIILQNQQTALSAALLRIAELEQRTSLQQAMLSGRGPTVK